jgi:type IV pilus assembly protein PilE
MEIRKQSGVTLIELMIAVAIVAILAAIAYPSYQRYVARTHRDSATACMSQYAQFMERYYTANMTYVGAAPGNLPCTLENSLNQRYTIGPRAGSLTASAYVIDATPVGTQLALDGSYCGTLSLNQAGVRSTSVAANRDQCWR